MNIDQNRKATHIPSPQDDEIRRLSEQMNKTYIPYGRSGGTAQRRQEEQDVNAKKAAPASSLQRARWKGSANYDNSHWDLVDALKNKKVKLSELKKERLPEWFRKLNPEQQKAKIAELQKQRADIQGKIRKLYEARKKFVAAEMKKLAGKNKDTLDAAMIEAVQKQAAKKKFQFGDK